MRSWPALVVRFPLEHAATWPDLVSAALDGLDVVAIDEPGVDSWRVCFRSGGARDQAVELLNPMLGMGLGIVSIDMPDEDWARRSQAALGAIRVGGVIIAPPWTPEATNRAAGAITTVIEPGMGFGSGHHATTRLCLWAMQQHVLRGRTVLDIGTGSGVLAIAAAQLAAASVVGVDVDEDALDSARTNAGLNNHPASLTFCHADFRSEPQPAADVVVANLTGAMLAASAADVLRACNPGGTVIVSGITAEESPVVAAAFSRIATIVSQETEDGWVCLVYRSPQTN